jgi:hypothetical protein
MLPAHLRQVFPQQFAGLRVPQTDVRRIAATAPAIARRTRPTRNHCRTPDLPPRPLALARSAAPTGPLPPPHPYRTTSAGSSIFTDGRGSSGSRAAAGSKTRASSRLTW